MSNASVFEQLDQAVSAFVVNPEGDGASYVSTKNLDAEVRELLETAAELSYVARPEFKQQLMRDLLDEAFVAGMNRRDVASHLSTDHKNGNGVSGRGARVPYPDYSVLPSLFTTAATNPAQHRNFATSVALHALVVGALVASSAWMAQRDVQSRVTTVLTDTEIYFTEPAREQESGGGGSGGDKSKLSASQGVPPKFSTEQLTPPIVVKSNPEPELAVPPTVLGREQNLPQLSRLGDPLSRVAPASNGTGSSGGIGSDMGTGVGGGKGPGVGLGSNGGYGGGVFRIGGGVSAPRPIYSPDPEYSEEARRVKHQGTVILWGIIGADGRPKQLRVAQALGMGLDQKALEAVTKWRFEPALRNGQPVAVQVNIQVNFRLY